MSKTYHVYIMASWTKVLYTGSTSRLEFRVAQHKQGLGSRFTAKYKCTRLVYFEDTSEAYEAVSRERQIKKWNRARKLRLIESMNPTWNDLAAYLD